MAAEDGRSEAPGAAIERRAGRSVLYIDSLGRLLPCTLTDNTTWRARVSGLEVGAAMDLYARELDAMPASSCSALLRAQPVAGAPAS